MNRTTPPPILLACCLLFAACAAPPAASPPDAGPGGTPGTAPSSEIVDIHENEVIVFAAASLTNAFDDLASAFEAAHPGVSVVRNYAASSQLATQLVEGALADVFASANERQMGVAVNAGRVAIPTVTFATNRLTIIVPADNPAGIDTIADLAQPGLKLILAERGVPVRDYADQAVASMAADPAFGAAFKQAVYDNLVSEESNVRQVVAKIALGEGDAGIVYISDVTPDVADQIKQIEIPDPFNVTAAYPVGTITDAPHPDLARAFVDFILSPDGQAILARWGFGAAPGG